MTCQIRDFFVIIIKLEQNQDRSVWFRCFPFRKFLLLRIWGM